MEFKEKLISSYLAFEEGLDLTDTVHETRANALKIFEEKGFEFREAGCSMCLAMNPDKLIGNQICASTSNRNFKGRQGSSTGRTLTTFEVYV